MTPLAGGGSTPLNSVSQHYSAQTISLNGIPAYPDSNLDTLGTVSVNGDLDVSDALILEPTVEPSNATPGQLYYNKTTHQLSLFNGTDFTELLSSNTNPVSSIGNTTGDITLGNGLSMQGNTLQNTGIVGIKAGNNITVTKDSKGNVIVSATGSSTNTNNTPPSNTSTNTMAGVASINNLSGNLTLQGTTNQLTTTTTGSTITLALDPQVSLLGQTIESNEITNATIQGNDIAGGTITGTNIAGSTVANTNLVNSSLTVTPGNGLTGGGSIALGSSGSLSVQAAPNGCITVDSNGTAVTNNCVDATTLDGHDTNYFQIAGDYAPATGSTNYAPASGSTNYAPADGSNSYIQNQTATTQTADFKINGSAIASTFDATTGYSANGTTGLTSLTCTSNEVLQNATIQGGIVTGGSCTTTSSGLSGTGTANQVAVFNSSGNLQGSDNILFNTQTASLTLGSSTLAGSLVLTDGATFTGTIQIATSGLTQDTVYVLPAVSQSIVQICTSAGNCASNMPSGNNPGDTMYWNGTQWITISSSGSGSHLLQRCDGAPAPTWQGCPPTVTTAAVTNIGGSDATGNGSVITNGALAITERGLVYATTQDPTTADNKAVNTTTGMGNFSVDIHNLDINTTYYVRAYATNSAGTAYGNQVSFTTLNIAKPTVTTNAITNDDTTATTANGGGNVTDGGDAPVTETGLVYSTTTNPTTADNKVASGSGVGNFTTTITGLTSNVTYYVRAYAINAGGTAYGNQISFTTPTVPTVATAAVTDITIYNTATSGGNVTGDGNHPVTERGIVYSTSPNPTLADTKIANGFGTGSFTVSMAGLTENTTYYVRAYATNDVGTGYGNQVSFMALGYEIGDTGPGGGIIFYDKGSVSDGWRWLEAAPAGWNGGTSDPAAAWGCYGTSISTGTAIGTGKQNTTNIEVACRTGGITARLAQYYHGGGYTDWFLPSVGEMDQILSHKSVIGGISGVYSTSSQESDINLWASDHLGHSKNSVSYHVRPIREF